MLVGSGGDAFPILTRALRGYGFLPRGEDAFAQDFELLTFLKLSFPGEDAFTGMVRQRGLRPEEAHKARRSRSMSALSFHVRALMPCEEGVRRAARRENHSRRAFASSSGVSPRK